MKIEEMLVLEELCKPVSDYLKNNWDPHCTVVITDSQIRLVRDEVGIPIRTAQEVPVQEQQISDELIEIVGEKLVSKISSELEKAIL